jgi:hypothetical protein
MNTPSPQSQFDSMIWLKWICDLAHRVCQISAKTDLGSSRLALIKRISPESTSATALAQ